MSIKSILAVTDFSIAAEHGLERAALIAARHQAKLQLIYGAEVPNLGLSDPFARVRQRGRQLARRHAITVEAVAHTGDMLDDVVKHASRANLLVLDHRRHHLLQTFWRGTTLDQLMRLCPCPMLIVKQMPCARYGRMLVAVDFTAESENLVRYASGFEAESELELFHSLETFNNAGLSSNTCTVEGMSACRQAALQDTLGRSLRFSNSFDTRRNRVTSITERGEPAREIAIHQEFVRSDLVIVGKNRNSTVIDFLFGNVARRLINWVTSDVLVVPHDYRAPSSAVAKERMQTILNGVR